MVLSGGGFLAAGTALRVYATLHTTHTSETDTGVGWGQRATTPRSPRLPELCSSAMARRQAQGSGSPEVWTPAADSPTAVRTDDPQWCAPRRTARRRFFFFLLLFLTDTELWRASQRSNADPKYLGVRRRRRELRDGWAEVYIAEPGGLPAAAAAAAGVQVQYLLDNRRGGPAEAGGKRWKPTACRFVKNLTE